MTTDVLQQLESLGKEQARKIYRRHGVGDNQYGVSYADLGKLKKRIKTDHALALTLWASGIHDARVLATMIADPQQADSAMLDAWARDLDNYVITDAFSTYVAATPFAQQQAERWIQSADEWIATAGWNLMGSLAGNDRALPDSYFEPYLATIERSLHTSPNRVRYAMNNVVITIGLRSDALEGQAVAAAGRIGKVIVDHGQTSCKTPDAIAYIAKTKAHRAQKQKA
jgi:3-methyladenine DNA glycosylase AlkD